MTTPTKLQKPTILGSADPSTAQVLLTLRYMKISIFPLTKQKNFGGNYTQKLWQYGLWSFQTGGTKLERFLHKNQHTKRKF